MRSLNRYLIALLGSLALCVSPAAFAKPEMVCPCSVASLGQTAWGIDVGLRNTEANITGELRFRLTLRDVNDATGAFFIGGFATPGISLAIEETLASMTYKTGLVVPGAGTYIMNLELQENQSGIWMTVDSLRMRQDVPLEHVGGSSSYSSVDDEVGALYFDGDVVVDSVSVGEITLDLPAIVNRSQTFTSTSLQLQFVRTAGPSVFDYFFSLGTIDLAGGLAPRGSIAAQTVTVPYSESGTTGDYVHLLLSPVGSNAVLAWQTIRWLGGVDQVERSLTLNGIELLEDDDGDGVSNFNERFAGTDPDSSYSTPGASQIDLLVKYTQNVPALYGGDASTRIDHLIGFSNQVLSASGVNAAFNLVGSGEVNTNELFTLSSYLDLMEAEQEGFEGLEAERVATGADIVVLLIPYSGGALCGLANLGGQGKKGDMSNPINANLAHATVYVDCRDNVTLHEIGHVMGLIHSRIESARENDTGTFDWSVGHGFDNSFATVMANTDDFGRASEEVNILSNPALLCDPSVDEFPPHTTGNPCGVDRSDLVNGADATLSLNTVRFQVAAFRDEVSGTDTDGDGMVDSVDTDDDNDGVPDSSDAFPLDDTESVDTDGDFIGNNADLDDDGDGIVDAADAFPLDASETVDTDNDGTGNNVDPDDDNDGVADAQDAFPLDPARSDEALTSRLVNIATRGFIGTGDDVMIAGLIIEGETNMSILIRARGPSLASVLNGAIDNTVLQLFDIAGNPLEVNFDWQDHPRSGEIPVSLAPTDPLESAIVVDLPAGGYTAILSGEGGSTGVGIVEVFELD